MSRLLLLVLFYAIPVISVAQIPANNECANATPITVSSLQTCENSVSATTVNATQSMAPCLGSVANDVWFQFTATNAAHIIRFTSTGMLGPIVQVFSGSCGSLTSIVCYNNPLTQTQNTYNKAVAGLTPGNTYFIRVYAIFANLAGTFNLCILPPTLNDECAGAVDIPVNTGLNWTTYVAGNNNLNTASGSVTNCITNNRADGWFKFTAQDTVQLIHIKGTIGNSSTTRLQAFEGNCGSLTQINALGYAGGLYTCFTPGSTDNFYSLRGLTSGNSYYIKVEQDMSYAPVVTDSFYLAISNVPANDGFTGAQEVTVNSGTDCISKTTGNLLNASATRGLTHNCGQFYNLYGTDLWYKFTATSSRHLIYANFLNTVQTPGFQVYYMDNGTLQPVSCGIGQNSQYFNELTSMTPGTVYYIRVSAGLNYLTDKLFELCVTTPGAGAPTNDACAAAQTLASGQTVLANIKDATNTASMNYGCDFTGGSPIDLWYTIAPSANYGASVQLIIPNTFPYQADNNVGIEVHSGACGSLTRLSCVNINSANITSLNFNEYAGTTYYLRIFSFNTTLNSPFSLTLSESVNLPVTITAFDAGRTQHGSVKLLWKTEEESGIDHYEIERSANGIQFERIAQMAARNASFTSEYTGEDVSPLSGISYYRLKIVERDDKVEYSKIVKLNIVNDGSFTGNLQAGREGGSIFINNQNADYKNVTLNIYTVSGQRLYSARKRLTGGVNRISLPGETAQPLFVQVITEDNEAKTFKIF